MPEVFIYSSNIGTAKMADVVGIEGHQEFLHRIGLLDKMPSELPEVATPVEPKEWKKINSMTISFGHGVSTTPLQTAVAAAALMNGGKLIAADLPAAQREEATGLPSRLSARRPATPCAICCSSMSEEGLRQARRGSGYRVGGKTGTAEKVVEGRYSSDKRFNAFLAAFPIDDPQYVVLVIIDEPKPEKARARPLPALMLRQW